jgi:uncharacterized membrane protein
MESLLQELAGNIALGIEVVAILVVAFGALEALLRLVRTLAPREATLARRKEIWRRFGGWLILGLEFELAADIVHSVIAPTWMEIGELGAIAVIRTFLNYFLEKDLERAGREGTANG